MKPLVFTLALASALNAGVVIDRIAAIVGKQVIKASDIDRDLRVTAFLNQSPLNLNAQARKQATERLIDQTIIRNEIASGGYNRASDTDADHMLDQIRRERFGGSDQRLRQALAPYGLTEDQLRAQLLWQLTVLAFIDERFRPGVLVTDEEVRQYYDQHLAELKRQYPRDNTFETLASKIRSNLEGERINEQFESWLESTRKQQRVEFPPGAPQ